jgi:DNA repair protein SbcC/Rad50
MQILSIRLKNIKSHRDTELSFSSGINVLSGPNGAGKSTVFEAIGYALFGVDARDFVSNVDRFLTIGTKKGEIAVAFRTDAGETWRVTRTVGAAAKWLLAKEEGGVFEVEEHAKTEETGARIAELLGLDNGRPLAEQFRLVIGPFQHEFLGPFVIRQATKRQDAFDEILGIDAWRKTFKGTSSLLAAVQEKIKVLAAEVDAREEQVAVLPEREGELAAANAARAARQAELLEATELLRLATERLQALDGEKAALDAAENLLKQAVASIESGKEHVATQAALVRQAEGAAKTVEDNRPGKEAFERAEMRLSELREREKLRRAAEREAGELEKQAERLAQAHAHERREIESTELHLAEEEKTLAEGRAALVPDLAIAAAVLRLPELRREGDRLKGERGLLEGRRRALQEGGEKLAEGSCPFFAEPCPSVEGKEPRELFSARIGEIDASIGRLDELLRKISDETAAAEKGERDLAALRVRGEELDRQIAAVESRRSRNRERAGKLDELKGRETEAAARAKLRKGELRAFEGLDGEIAAAEAERSAHQAARDLFHAALRDAGELEKRRETLEKWRQRLDELQRTMEGQRDAAGRLREEYAPERHDAERAAKEGLVGRTAALRQELEDLEKERLRLERDLADLNRVREEIAAKLAEKSAFEEKEKLVKFLRNQVFKNVSAQLSERFREEITLRADRIYRTIAETDEELVWGEDYRIVLRDMANGEVRERTDDQLSGGQTMSAVVALRLALLQTIGARIAFFDEPTSNLDAGRRENLAHAFRAIDVGREEVTEHWYDQLFLISHDVAFTEITDQIVLIGD